MIIIAINLKTIKVLYCFCSARNPIVSWYDSDFKLKMSQKETISLFCFYCVFIRSETQYQQTKSVLSLEQVSLGFKIQL